MNQLKKSRWGLGIAFLYGSFVLFILAIVALASFQHIDMVEDHYYDKELVYQEHIDRINRTNALAERPSVRLDGAQHQVILVFPESMPYDRVTGMVVLYRPSGAVMDFSVPIQLDVDHRQLIPVGKLPAGFWKAKLDWRVGADEYYIEESLFLN